jgi:[ribosomal protein S18]-alanine N-acetyltransferase
MKSALRGHLKFEPLKPKHLPAVLAIENKVNIAPWSERSFNNEVDHPHGIFLAAILDGEVIGYGGVWLVVDEAHVINIAIEDGKRRRGIGFEVMQELLRQSKEAGMACSTLEVRAGNEAAISMYEKLGYIRAGLRKNYYPVNKEDAVVMWLYELQDWEPLD